MNNNAATTTTPDYASAATATAAGNLGGAQTATQANRVNQGTAYGGLQYSQNGDGSWNAIQNLSAPVSQAVNQSMSNLNQQLVNPSSGINPGESYTQSMMRQLQPNIDMQNEQSNSDLANQGIMPGSQAYINAKRQLASNQNNLYDQAVTSGMQVGQNQQTLDNQTATAVKGLATPNLVNSYNQTATAGPDYMGASGLYNQGQIANMNATNATNANFNSGLYGLGGALLGNKNFTSGLGSALGALPGLASSGYNWLSGLGTQTGSPFTGADAWMNNADWASGNF